MGEMEKVWTERLDGGQWIFEANAPAGLVVAFSGRGSAPSREASPTAFLARRFAELLALDGTPIVRATQVHGNRAVIVREAPGGGEVFDAGPCDALATELPGLALVVQTADCVPIALAGARAVAVVHAGWRGCAANAAASAVDALRALGESPLELRAWLGPSIGPCCYQVGGEVASQFGNEFLRADGGAWRLDLRGINRAQLEAAGVSSDEIVVHPDCTMCGGQKYASYRRDGVKSGRMIALVDRLAS